VPRLAPHLLLAVFLATAPAAAQGGEGFAYVKDTGVAAAGDVAVVDARALDACTTRSLPGARCLPAIDVLGPHGRLAAISDVLWLLGTAGLDGSEHVLVAGDDAVERDFIAGLLYLAGQSRVSVLTEPISRLTAGEGAKWDSGAERSNTREKVYQAPVRDGLIVLRNDLAALLSEGIAPVLLDGRSEKEYWGERIRGQRGGHVPGAQHLEMPALRSAAANGRALVPIAAQPVAYGHDTVESIALFTLLRAGTDTDARVLIDGWADWATHTALPVDSVTYPDSALKVQVPAAPVTSKMFAGVQEWMVVVAALAVGGVLAAGGFFLGKWSRV
jgi:thiosulfate/3-mercaptopyruvate sulfurtransferase